MPRVYNPRLARICCRYCNSPQRELKSQRFARTAFEYGAILGRSTDFSIGDKSFRADQ
jgi:hypothetical protein